MNPLDSILKFITDSRAVGIPDRVIFEGLQVAMVEATFIQLANAEGKSPVKSTPSRPVVGFVNSAK